MADNQSRKYKITWLDNLSAYTGRAYNRSINNLHTVVFSGLYDYDENSEEALSIKQIYNDDVIKFVDNNDENNPVYHEYWKHWHNDFNIYKGGIRYTKFVDVDENEIYIDDYKISLKFDYPTGIVSLTKTFTDNFKYYIGQINPRELQKPENADKWLNGTISYNDTLNINVIKDYRTNNNFKLFDDTKKYFIVLPASLYKCGYMPMHDIEESDLQQDENSYHKFYITYNGISYICFMSDYATNKYVGIIGKKL